MKIVPKSHHVARASLRPKRGGDRAKDRTLLVQDTSPRLGSFPLWRRSRRQGGAA